jgi:hypothetical protein
LLVERSGFRVELDTSLGLNLDVVPC